ncbi:uncharacterized protein LOC129919607 isoform X2 [Episyrphus balteatus]|uniref:uncharacterized protein LOC129919607 isoform X2 n=1 Tax=Episyrphus balteatus TaxID=286459 RepID=UPI0024855694|nr:uncharacterized protein LOC129919607 isoform X2 [Episyrphus balteatus]
MSATFNGTNGIQTNISQLETLPNKIFLVPNWLEEKLFANIVKNDYGEASKITNFTVTPATKPGENSSSVMFRVTIDVDLMDGCTKTISFILKTNHNDDSMLSLLENLMLFPKEQEMYGSIIPKFESLFEEAGKCVSFAPRSYKFSQNLSLEYVLLEDISRKNFRTANRLVGLDMTHMKHALTKLAEFHAVSACLHERNGSYGEQFMYSIFTEKYRSILTTLNSSAMFLNHLKKWKNCSQYAEMLADSDNCLVDRIIQAAKFNPSEFNVLNHGDFWSNNIMFQYDAFGKIKETCFIDFQLCKYGSPAYDLYYLILTSAQMNIKLSQFDYMIKYYHDNLIANLMRLEYHRPLPKLRNLHMALLKNGLSAYLIVSQILPAVMFDLGSISNIDREDEFKLKSAMYSNFTYVKAMQEIMPWLDNRGLLDLC